jgi:biotin-(acetyl-CoA carboxylase) ligase
VKKGFNKSERIETEPANAEVFQTQEAREKTLPALCTAALWCSVEQHFSRGAQDRQWCSSPHSGAHVSRFLCQPFHPFSLQI